MKAIFKPLSLFFITIMLKTVVADPCTSEMSCIKANSNDGSFRCVTETKGAKQGVCMWEYNQKSEHTMCLPNTQTEMYKVRARGLDRPITVCQNKYRNNQPKATVAINKQIQKNKGMQKKSSSKNKKKGPIVKPKVERPKPVVIQEKQDGEARQCDSEVQCIKLNYGDANFRCVTPTKGNKFGRCMWEYNEKSRPKNCIEGTEKMLFKVRARGLDPKVSVCENRHRGIQPTTDPQDVLLPDIYNEKGPDINGHIPKREKKPLVPDNRPVPNYMKKLEDNPNDRQKKIQQYQKKIFNNIQNKISDEKKGNQKIYKKKNQNVPNYMKGLNKNNYQAPYKRII